MSAWPLVRLGDIARPKQYPVLSRAEMTEAGYPVYGANGRIGFASTFTHTAPTILIGCRGSCGTVHITEPRSYANGNAMALDKIDLRKFDLEFLYYFFASRGFSDVTTGSSQPQIIGQNLVRVEIPAPPLAEQRRIAAILDQADALRAKRRAALAQLDEMAQAIFVEMFGDPLSAPIAWPVVKVGDVTDCIVPGRDKPKSFTGAIPWITTSDLVHLGETQSKNAKFGLSNHEINEVRAKIIPSNSVIITCVGDLGIASISRDPMVINQQLHAFQCGGKIKPIYLMYSLSHQTAYMYKMATQTTLPYMNKSVCNSIPVPLPPIELQNQFSNRIAHVWAIRQTMIANAGEIEALQSALQHRAFNGEL